MFRQCVFVGFLVLGSLTGLNAKEAEAANEDVPKGPGFNAPQSKATGPQSGQKPAASTGSVNGADKKGAASGGGESGSGGGGKSGASQK
jgi:hypothetical protein